MLTHRVQEHPADHSKPCSGYPAKNERYKEAINLEPSLVPSNYYRRYLLSAISLAEEERFYLIAGFPMARSHFLFARPLGGKKHNVIKNTGFDGRWWRTRRRSRQVDLCECEASLVCKGSTRTFRTVRQRKLVSNQQQQNKQKRAQALTPWLWHL